MGRRESRVQNPKFKVQILRDQTRPISTSRFRGKSSTPKAIRLGLFGGSFNPIHFGHLRAGLEIQEAFSLNQILFIPTAVPPHKEIRNLLPFAHRLKMIHLAIAGNPSLQVSDVEKKRAGKSYTIETVRFFKDTLDPGSELFFILGIDAFREIETWRDYRNLFKFCHFVVMDRPGYRRDHIKTFMLEKISPDMLFFPRENRFQHPSGYSIYLFPVTLMDISSTRIRWLRQNNQTIHYLLPEKVEDYILERKLYAA